MTAARRHPQLAGVTASYVAAWTAYGMATGSAGVYAYLVWMVIAAGIVMYVDGLARFSTHTTVASFRMSLTRFHAFRRNHHGSPPQPRAGAPRSWMGRWMRRAATDSPMASSQTGR